MVTAFLGKTFPFPTMNPWCKLLPWSYAHRMKTAAIASSDASVNTWACFLTISSVGTARKGQGISRFSRWHSFCFHCSHSSWYSFVKVSRLREFWFWMHRIVNSSLSLNCAAWKDYPSIDRETDIKSFAKCSPKWNVFQNITVVRYKLMKCKSLQHIRNVYSSCIYSHFKALKHLLNMNTINFLT